MEDNKNYVDMIIAFYGVPYISDFAIISVIFGVSKWGPYKEGLNPIQVRLIGLIALILCVYVSFKVLIK